MPHISENEVEKQLRAAFKAGWSMSAEGFNAEHWYGDIDVKLENAFLEFKETLPAIQPAPQSDEVREIHKQYFKCENTGYDGYTECLAFKSKEDVANFIRAAQSAPVDLERVREVVRPFAFAYRASEKVIVEDMPASDRPSHVVRSTTYWLSLKNFKDASEYLNELASITTPSKE